MSDKKIRLRFPPSPTGFLHIGSLRTVLYNHIIAKKLGGKFYLRIEDTDQARKVEGAVEALYDILDWLGFKFDEGPREGGEYGPYIQSERMDLYQKYAEQLVKEGKAYYCFCTPERLQKMREDQQAKKEAPRYDRACRDLSEEEVQKRIAAGEKYVIRQKMPLEGEVKVYDELRGEIIFPAKDLEDHVLMKTDGLPTYQLAHVVDDHLMETSHVLRGEEWIPSMPKNVLLFQAFGWEVPKYIHLALTLNKEGGKLSKRQGDVAVEDYRRKGYLPEALINFSALQGWHPKNDNEILTLDEIIEKFEIKDMKKGGSIFDIDKLDYLNGHYIRTLDDKFYVERCVDFLEKYWRQDGTRDLIDKDKASDKDYVAKVVKLFQERLKMFYEIGELSDFFFTPELSYNHELLIWKKLTAEEVKNNLEQVYAELEKIPEENWTQHSIEDALITYIKAKDAKVGDFLWPMRVSLSGKKASPGPFEIAEVLGKEESLKRVKQGIEKL